MRRMFAGLRDCTSFLAAIRGVESFVRQEKVIVPNKFIIIDESKDIERRKIFSPTNRFSVKN